MEDDQHVGEAQRSREVALALHFIPCATRAVGYCARIPPCSHSKNLLIGLAFNCSPFAGPHERSGEIQLTGRQIGDFWHSSRRTRRASPDVLVHVCAHVARDAGQEAERDGVAHQRERDDQDGMGMAGGHAVGREVGEREVSEPPKVTYVS